MKQQLIAAKALIDTPEKWTQGAAARFSQGGWSCATTDPHATCFCSIGALDRIFVSVIEYLRAKDHLSPFMNYSIPGFNDSRTHEEVMAAWDRAIEAAQ